MFTPNHSLLLGGIILSIILLMGIFAPFFSSHSYYDTNLELKNQLPSTRFWFGTDELGRDIFTRVWWGARVSLTVGVCAALLDLIIGVLWGAIAAFSKKKIDELMMRSCDIINSVPYLLTVLILLVIIGPGLFTIIFALAATGWINMARVVRGQVLLLKESEYVLAVKAMGASQLRIILRHLIPNAIGPIIATMAITIPNAIFTEAFLSFIGLGVQAPVASWGVMVNDSLGALCYYPWRLFFPAFFITITMLSFHLLADGLRDALDPRIT